MSSVVWAEEAQSVQRLAPIEVKGIAPGTDPDMAVERAREALNIVAGSATVVSAQDYRQGVVTGLGGVLSRVPGVYAASPSGQVSTRLSIRGSGMSATSGLRGIRLLRDGLPLGRSDDLGDSIYADPFSASYITVYRGASSLQYGAATLGGAINLVSPTGQDNPGAEIRAEVGADGYRQGQIRAGEVFKGGWDAYAAVTDFRSDGFRENSAQHLTRFYGNLGHAFGPRSQGRVHLTSERYQVHMPGALTLAQIQHDPSVANAANPQAEARIRTSPRWHVAYQHDWQIGAADELAFGIFHTGTRFDSPGTGARALYDAVDYGVSLRHVIERRLGMEERRNRLVWGVSYSRGSSDNELWTPSYLPIPARRFGTVESRRSTLEAFAENHYYVMPALALVTGVQVMRARRHAHNDVLIPLPGYPAGRAAATYTGFNPKLGLLWETANGKGQIYANISQSTEAPNSVNFYTSTGTLATQRATTLEIGSRGGDSRLGWDVAVYRSQVKNELLQTPNTSNPSQPLAFQVPATRHQGLELGLQGQQPMSALDASLHWRLTYTWNDFRFTDDARYANNTLPSIPEHVAQLVLTYRHVSGVYAGPQVQLASAWQVDQANTLQAPGFGVVNFTLGYAPPKRGYRVFLEMRNVANKHYVATTDYVVDARTQRLDVFYPGQSRIAFLGMQVNW